MNSAATSRTKWCILLIRMTMRCQRPLWGLGIAGVFALVLAAHAAGQQQSPPAPLVSPTPAEAAALVQPVDASSQEAGESEAVKLPLTSDPREIVRRSVEVDHHNFERARKYTCTQHE